MPTTATPCVRPRGRAGWRSWVCSDPSPGHGCRTKTRTPNHCSEQRNTGLTTQDGHSPALRKPACGWPHSSTGTTTGIATAASSSSRPNSATAARPWRSAGTGVSSTSRPDSEIRAAGHDPSAVGLNQKWFGSIHHSQKTNRCRLRLPWLPEQQQGRHLCWQLPPWGPKQTGEAIHDTGLHMQPGHLSHP